VAFATTGRDRPVIDVRVVLAVTAVSAVASATIGDVMNVFMVG
jgi:hypothetical protein